MKFVSMPADLVEKCRDGYTPKVENEGFVHSEGFPLYTFLSRTAKYEHIIPINFCGVAVSSLWKLAVTFDLSPSFSPDVKFPKIIEL